MISSAQPVSGGDINKAYRLAGKEKNYFLKLNDAKAYPDMFRLESKGLLTLGNITPGVLMHGQFGGTAFLLMPWIAPGVNSRLTQENLGRTVAMLHQRTTSEFGLDDDNYIGTMRQINTRCADWTQFFLQNRIEYQLKIAQHKGLTDRRMTKRFEALYHRFEDLYPPEPPSLLHGDMWSGNYLIAQDGQPLLIDPAIYYGHREMDIAMATLFGGFSPDFYHAYDEQAPLQEGWQHRLSLWQLYPLLVHVNLFGRSYLPQLGACLQKWV